MIAPVTLYLFCVDGNGGPNGVVCLNTAMTLVMVQLDVLANGLDIER